MSKMSDIHLDIQNLLEAGFTAAEVVHELDVPIGWVEAVIEDEADDYDDSMDGDHASALASAGWGTDEDYGYFGEDY